MKTFDKFASRISGTFRTFLMLSFVLTLFACGNSASKDSETAAAVDDDAFYATQPLHSGLYDADYYDVSGVKTQKGPFDGRIYFSLSPETSAFYVFENGNRTKIDYMVPLQKPFEKTDSGFVSIDTKDRPVVINTDSATYILTFHRSGEDLKINFNPKARSEGRALDILEKMAAQKNKK